LVERFLGRPGGVAYLWVDGDFPALRENRDHYATIAQDRDVAHHYDNLDLLKDSFCRLTAYVPWIGKHLSRHLPSETVPARRILRAPNLGITTNSYTRICCRPSTAMR
jgi:hypothetical protein